MDGLAWLPLSVRRAQAAEERLEAQQARESARALAERVEARRAADFAVFAREAEDRGERIDPVQLSLGRVTGRTALDVLREAEAAADRQDAQAEVEARRTRGERLNLIGELADPSARSRPMTATARAVERTDEKFRASVAAAAEARRRRGELEQAMPQLAPPHWSAGRSRGTSNRAQGFGPMNVPWSQVSGWLARGGDRDHPGPGPGQLCRLVRHPARPSRRGHDGPRRAADRQHPGRAERRGLAC
jgi:hypothetical protein